MIEKLISNPDLNFRGQLFQDMLKLSIDEVKDHPETWQSLIHAYDRQNVCLCCLDSSHLDYIPSVLYDHRHSRYYQCNYSIFELMKLIMDDNVPVQLDDNVTFMVNIYRDMKTVEDELTVIRMYNNYLLGNNMFLGLNPSFKGMIYAIVLQMKHCYMHIVIDEMDTTEFFKYIERY